MRAKGAGQNSPDSDSSTPAIARVAGQPDAGGGAASFESIVSKSTGILALAVAIGVAFSVVYDWGFVHGLGVRLDTVPTSLTDHARTGILWAPFVAPMLLFTQVFTAFMDRHVAPILDRDEESERSRVRRARERIWSHVGWAALVAFVFYGAFGHRAMGLVALVTMFALIAAVETTLKPKKHPDTDSTILFRYSILALGIIVFVMFLVGFSRGKDVLIDRERPSVIVDYRAPDESVRQALVARTYESFLIAIDVDRIVLVLRNEQVVGLRSAAPTRVDTGYFCLAWSLGCPQYNTDLLPRQLATDEVTTKKESRSGPP